MKKNVLVIGGGLAGSLICNELAGNFDVTLLEIGEKNQISYPEVKFLNKKFAEVKTFCFGGGGTTNLWHNGLIPIHEEDVSCSVFRGVLSDARKFTDRAASALFFSKKSYTDEYENLNNEVNLLLERIGAFSGAADCLVYPKHFKKLTVDSNINDIYSVDMIDFSYADGKITDVRYRANGTVHSICPEVVIVSAGTLGSPKVVDSILSSTGKQMPELGTGFIDHPIGFVGKVKFPPHLTSLFAKLSIYDKGDFVSRNAIRLKSDCGKYTCGVFFRPAMSMDNRLQIYKYKSLLGASKGMDRLKNLLSMKVFHPDIIAEIISHLFSVRIPGRIFNIFLIAEQRRGKSKVFYEGDQLQVDWEISEKELSIYNDLLKRLEDMLSGIAEEINIKTDITEEWLWSGAHHSGTISLGDAENDLVDSNLRLKFCDNVYVCDGSVIQEHSYANTGLTIGQLAFRLCDRISTL